MIIYTTYIKDIESTSFSKDKTKLCLLTSSAMKKRSCTCKTHTGKPKTELSETTY